MIPDKYHNEWVIRDMKIDVRIFKAQSLAFHFLSDMAYDLDNSIEMLNGIRQIHIMLMQLELLKRKCFYLKVANGIGKMWKQKVEQKER